MRAVLLAMTMLLAVPAFAGDRATLLFKSGQIVVVDDGYQKIVEEYRRLTRESSDHRIIELTISSSSFLINLAEVVVVCRDDCRSLFYSHQLDPKRAK